MKTPELVRRKKQMVEYYEYLIKAKTKMMKWISTIKEDLDAAGRKRSDITDRKC